MKYQILILMIFSMQAFSQVEKSVDSKITDVTVFLNKAQVTREVKTRLEAGKTNIYLSGLTSMLDPQSIQVSGKGNVMILGIKHQQNFLNDMNMPKPLKILKDSMEVLQRQTGMEQNLKDILAKEEQMLLSNQKIGGANQNLTASELKAMADFYRMRLTDITTSRMKSEEKIKKLNDRISRLQAQLNELSDIYRTNTSEIVINVSSELSNSIELKVSYIVANAGWNALYDLRAMNTKSPIQLNYKANVFQRTGEEWKNVKLKLSTANPSQGGLKPELQPWYLDFYNPIIYPQQSDGRKQKSYAPAMRAEGVAVMADVEMEAQSLSEFVSTVQTSLNTEFEISIPYTILSASKPTIVDIQNYEVKADFLYSAAPKLEKDVFLLAKARGWADFNLLPGDANIFFEGTYVGKSFIDPNSTNDTLNFSLGRDKRIVVNREKVKDLTNRSTIGSSKKESYTWEIAVRNNKSESVIIVLEDQIPVTMNTQIEVTLMDSGGAKYDKQTGKLLWKIELKPNEARKLQYKFEVKYPKDKQVTGL